MAVPKSVPKPHSVEFTKAVCKKKPTKTGENADEKKMKLYGSPDLFRKDLLGSVDKC